MLVDAMHTLRVQLPVHIRMVLLEPFFALLHCAAEFTILQHISN